MRAFTVPALASLLLTTPLGAGTLTTAGALTTPREDVTATLLPDGRILVAGGPGATVEIVDPVPAALAAEAVGMTTLPLTGHTATALPDGRVLLIGGGYRTDGRPTFGHYGSRDVDVYADHRLAPLTQLSRERIGHDATLLSDGRVLITGGHTTDLGGFHIWVEYLSAAEIFDPASNSAHEIPPMHQPRTNHTATRLADGRVLIAGGQVESWRGLSSAELFNPATAAFEVLPDMITPRRGHTATLLADGRVLLAGGAEEGFASAEFFDPASNTFSPAPGADIGYRRAHTATLLRDGTVFIAGGHLDAVLYDPASDTIVDQVLFESDLYDHAAVSLPAGGVLILGGRNLHGQLQDRILLYTRNAPARPRAVRK